MMPTAILPNSVLRTIPILTSMKAFMVAVEAVVVVEVEGAAVCINSTPASSLNSHPVDLPFTPVKSIPWGPRVFTCNSNSNSSNNVRAVLVNGRQIIVAPIHYEVWPISFHRTRRNRSEMSVSRQSVPLHGLEVSAVISDRWCPQLMLRNMMMVAVGVVVVVAVVEDKKHQTLYRPTAVFQL
ncbi:unnamed protein product [Hydatigera taeniaeformis]|uniref:Uncharacterized protein n=1 Tax=Hydatigena taeniaeformis TaxID=6205 RepID=A0A3P7ER13_HYDTA|nr:unnamed protein product [Hydatigera taeniaeformis]